VATRREPYIIRLLYENHTDDTIFTDNLHPALFWSFRNVHSI